MKINDSIIAKLKEIRKLTIIALFSDDLLMNIFVLKGGSALNFAYNIDLRESIDIDISMSEDFNENQLEIIKTKLEKTLIQTFTEKNYFVFDIKLISKPLKTRNNIDNTWGGYFLEFKIIEKDKQKIFKKNIDKMRKQSIIVGDKNIRIFRVDISKFEYFENPLEIEIEGFLIYAYKPLILLYEKLRAICQQMDEYIKIIPTTKKPRARDFFDIYLLFENFPGLKKEFYQKNNIELLCKVFSIKKVPLELLGKIEEYREYHRDNFQTIIPMVRMELETYDYYFDYTLEKVEKLKTFWNK